MVEWCDHLHEHFVHPAVVKSARYVTPTVKNLVFEIFSGKIKLRRFQTPGYNSQLKSESYEAYRYPDGPVWQMLIKHGKF